VQLKIALLRQAIDTHLLHPVLSEQLVASAREELEQAFNRPPASDREALERLHKQLVGAGVAAVTAGWHGGGGTRVRPPQLNLPPEGQPARRPIEGSTLPVDVLLSASEMFGGEQGASAAQQERLRLVKELTEMKAMVDAVLLAEPSDFDRGVRALPPAVLQAARAAAAQSGATSPTQREQLELLSKMLQEAGIGGALAGQGAPGSAPLREAAGGGEQLGSPSLPPLVQQVHVLLGAVCCARYSSCARKGPAQAA